MYHSCFGKVISYCSDNLLVIFLGFSPFSYGVDLVSLISSQKSLDTRFGILKTFLGVLRALSEVKKNFFTDFY